MRVICIDNKQSGFFKNKKFNLTIGQEYQVTPVLNNTSLSYFFASDYSFMVYTDEGEWELLPLELFKPK